jgi:hypothetical protein
VKVPRQSQKRMQVAVLHEYFRNLTCLVFKQAVIWQDNGSAAPVLKDVHNMLNKVELFAARGDSEIVPIRRLVRTFCAEWRIC